jgi:hypothetical protein
VGTSARGIKVGNMMTVRNPSSKNKAQVHNARFGLRLFTHTIMSNSGFRCHHLPYCELTNLGIGKYFVPY